MKWDYTAADKDAAKIWIGQCRLSIIRPLVPATSTEQLNQIINNNNNNNNNNNYYYYYYNGKGARKDR